MPKESKGLDPEGPLALSKMKKFLVKIKIKIKEKKLIYCIYVFCAANVVKMIDVHHFMFKSRKTIRKF